MMILLPKKMKREHGGLLLRGEGIDTDSSPASSAMHLLIEVYHCLFVHGKSAEGCLISIAVLVGKT